MMDGFIPLVRLEPASRPEPQLPDSAQCRYNQYEAPVRYYPARWLGFEPGITMVRRVAVLIIDGQPVLSSTSYLPVELMGDTDDWHQVELGRLALADYPITMAGEQRCYSRLPTTMERSTLGIPAFAEVPISLYIRPYYIHGAEPDPLRAGVIVRTRSDRMVWQIGHDYCGLLLQPELGSWP